MIDKIMIVAHPDDEALFGGAELLSHPNEYKVVVIDEYHNDIRRREFLDSMRFIGIHEYEHWTGFKGGEDYHREKLIYELLRVLRERKYRLKMLSAARMITTRSLSRSTHSYRKLVYLIKTRTSLRSPNWQDQ